MIGELKIYGFFTLKKPGFIQAGSLQRINDNDFVAIKKISEDYKPIIQSTEENNFNKGDNNLES